MFDPNPKMSQFKYAFTGTNCSGKTTMALATAARMKRMAVLAELVSSQDRKISWKDDYFPFTPVAHYGMITNLIHAEVQAMLKGDADVIVTDRSVLDLYAIMCTDHPDDPMTIGLENAVLAWMKTYTKVFYLAPLPYQEDGKRPADDFRMRTHATLRRLMDEYNLPNVVIIDREEVFKQIAKEMGFHVPNPVFAQDENWQAIANEVKVAIAVKDQTCETTSDIDVWACLTPVQAIANVHLSSSTIDARVRLLAQAYFGPLPFNVMYTSTNALPRFNDPELNGKVKVYEPR
jgi:hypothetical protein